MNENLFNFQVGEMELVMDMLKRIGDWGEKVFE